MSAGSDDVSVPGLLRLARRNAQAARRTYDSLGEALADGGTADVTLTDLQRSILSQMLRQAISDIYASLRWLFLAAMEDGPETGRGAGPNLPPEMETRVYALMSRRGLLKDAALIEAITHRLYQHQLEQATRPPDRKRWTNAPSLESPGDFFDQPLPEFSPVSRRIAAYVIDRSRRADRYGNPVLVPGEYDPQLYERLHWGVAAALRHTLAEEGDGDPCDLDARIESAAAETIRHSLAIAAAPTAAAEASRVLDEAGLLTIDTVHRLLRAGEILLFEETFARLAGLRPVLLRRLVYESGGECFAVLARALDVELDQAFAIFALTRSGRANRFHGRNGADAPLKAIYGAVSRDDANAVRAHWMRQPGFADALWAAEPDRHGIPAKTLH